MLILPDRGLRPDLPEGVTPVLVDGQAREAVFDERAVAVLRRPGSDRNELPALLRAWFGADAGLPGTDLHAAFERDAEGACRLAPLERPGRQAGPEPWRQYPREQIPPLFGLAYSQARWNQGFVDLGDRIVLLVTLDKSARPAGHRYRDRFLAPDRFEWQSQNRQRRAGKAGQRMARHVALGIAVHLFVRRTSKVGGRPAPFVYCGECEFEDWQGDRPITVRWRLRQPVPDRWRPALDVPAAPGAGA